jgi:transposase
MARRSMAVADIKEILAQWDAGEEISRIARALGYSRPTVRKYVRAAQRLGLAPGDRWRDEVQWDRLASDALAAVAHERPPGAVTQDVARFHAYLDTRVGQVHLSVLHQRLRDEHALAASWGTFYRYVRRHWPDRLARTPRLTVRLDDPPPGAEAQVDFFYGGRWFDPEAGRERRVYAFLMTLSHSRHQFLYPVLGEDSAAWLEGHVAAFTFFGGVPKRIVPDNLSAGVLRADRYDPRLNRAYGELARYYGCVIDPSRVATPTDKPRVERNVRYARDSFFTDRAFPSLAVMRTAAATWSREVAGQRVHGTTREQPLVAFATREQPRLLPLPPVPWELATWTTAKVQPDCHLTVGGAHYSVPHRYVGQRLEVRLGQGTVQIYDGPTLITAHARRTHGRVTRLEHYPEAGQAFLRATPRACVEQAQTIGPAITTLIRGLLITETLHQLREAQAVLRLPQQYPPERVERACQLALDAGDGRLRTVRGLLEREVEQLEPVPVEVVRPAGAFLRGPEAFRTMGTGAEVRA